MGVSACAKLSPAPPVARHAPRRFGALDAVWLAIAAAYPFVVLNFATLQVDDGDFWWTLALGRATWLAGALPAADPLPYTPTPGPYLQAQWLAGLLLYGAYQLGGFAALLVLRSVCVGGAFALLYLGCRRTGAAPALAGLCTLLALPVVNVGLSLRPQIFALVPFLLYLEGTRRPLAAGRALYFLPLVMVFWANVHGSFVFGLLLVGLALGARLLDLGRAGRLRAAARDAETRALAVLLGLSALAPLVNPYGLGLLGYLRDYLAVNPAHLAVGGLLTEWLPTSLATPGGVPFFCSAIALLLVLYVNARRAGSPSLAFGLGTAEALRLLVFAWLALRWIRAIVWWGLVLPAPLAGLLQRALVGAPAGSPPPGRPALNRLLLGLTLAVAVGSLPWWRAALPSLTPDVRAMVEPVPLAEAADRVLPAERAGQVFHYVAWGGYLAWRLGPGQRIFVDGRYEAYRPEVFEDYTRISAAEPGWDTRLAHYGVGQLVLSRAGQPALVDAAASSPAWQLVYDQGDVVVYRLTYPPSPLPMREGGEGRILRPLALRQGGALVAGMAGSPLP